MLTARQKTNRRQWTAALRSGKYQQAKGALLSPRGFCCLGVYCEMKAPDAWVSATLGEDHYGYHQFGGQQLYAPVQRGHLGMSAELMSNLIFLNDEAGATFEEIADVIDLDTLMQQDGALREFE